ncbi:MAG: hypothetical protein BAJALOKI1v1_780009 [Promethearchaeota archaeon]|nr:MAG: hypothetical protein BAJALOKI1v1_780009 [Candidatus Lokiarchaeota archaeon]
MVKIRIPEDYITVIKNQALRSENEIYGWLIGYVGNSTSNVIALFECKKFIQQTLISAIPHAQEFQEISSILPQGIGPIGIYHSHPFSSEVFHSHTDDKTLLSLSKQFQESISLVTNGQDINFFKIHHNNIISDIRAEFGVPKIPSFVSFKLNIQFKILIPNKDFINQKKSNSIKMKIFNRIGDFLEDTWQNIKLLYGNKIFSPKNTVKNFLINEINGRALKIKLTDHNDHITLYLNDKLENNNALYKIPGKDVDSYTLELNIKSPIYITEEQKTIQDILEAVKTELIRNNILPKIYNSYIDNLNHKIIIPEDIFINFFGIYIRLLSFCAEGEEDKQIDTHPSLKFLLKLLSLIDTFLTSTLNKSAIDDIASLFSQIRMLHKKFHFTHQFKSDLKSINKKFSSKYKRMSQ